MLWRPKQGAAVPPWRQVVSVSANPCASFSPLSNLLEILAINQAALVRQRWSVAAPAFYFVVAKYCQAQESSSHDQRLVRVEATKDGASDKWCRLVGGGANLVYRNYSATVVYWCRLRGDKLIGQQIQGLLPRVDVIGGASAAWAWLPTASLSSEQ